MAFLRSRERGEGKIDAGPVTAFWKEQINGRVSITLTNQTIDQVLRLMSLPPNAQIRITFAQLWMIPSPSSTLANRIMYLGLVAANEAEVTLGAEFFDRFIDLVAIKQQIAGTPANFVEYLIDGRQVWVDEDFDTRGGVSLESVHDGIYLFAQNTSTTDTSMSLIGRVHVEMILHQMNWADDYTQDNMRVTEGWAGYEWEESLGDVHEIFDDGMM